MVRQRLNLLGLLHKRGMEGDVDFLREALGVLVEAIVEAESRDKTGADYGERTPKRLTHRNGYEIRLGTPG